MTAPTSLPKQTRTVALSVRAGSSSTDGSLDVSLSSEEPVRRLYGHEILSHARKSVDFVYARFGLPLLLGHDGAQVGIVENVKLKDGRLIGTARPGAHPDAAHVFQDMRDGVRRHLSIGYIVHEVTLVQSDDKGDTYRADRWTPVEVSTVPVPADVTVGVGRAKAR
jgi:HK97 family phage prohead protease